MPGSDEEMDKLAEEEEEEALALQKHMAACLEEQDFDTAEFEVRSSWSYGHIQVTGRPIDHNQPSFCSMKQLWVRNTSTIAPSFLSAFNRL